MVIVIAVDENNIIKRVDIPLSDEHLQAILNNNPNLITVETDLDLSNIQIVDNYKLVNNELVELEEHEKQKDISIYKQNKILESKLKLSEYLEAHPILSYCHNGEPDYYNVTMEKQTQLNALVTLMDKAQQMEIPFTPMWNATGKECEEWTYQEIYQLSFEIYNYVKPLVTEQQRLEVLIQSLNTREEIENLVIDYDNVS